MSGTGRAPKAAAEAASLPEGVTLATWAMERDRLQNQRIRCVLGSTRRLDEVLVSDFAILLAAPRRAKLTDRRALSFKKKSGG